MSLIHAFDEPVARTLARPANDDAADALERMGVRMNFAKDEEIFAQEEEADRIYRVVSGVVRTSRLSSDGRRQIGEFYYPGDLFGLEPGDEHRFSAEALGDCVILVLKRTALLNVARDPELQHLIWGATTRELERAREHLMLLGRKTACEKVATFLVDVCRRQGGGSAELAMSRQDMADYLGLTIETVSRMVSQLQASALVEFAGCRRFRITNTAAMERLAQ